MPTEMQAAFRTLRVPSFQMHLKYHDTFQNPTFATSRF